MTGKYRKGQDAYLAAYDVHRGKVFGRCESFGGFLAAVGGAVVLDPEHPVLEAAFSCSPRPGKVCGLILVDMRPVSYTHLTLPTILLV